MPWLSYAHQYYVWEGWRLSSKTISLAEPLLTHAALKMHIQLPNSRRSWRTTYKFRTNRQVTHAHKVSHQTAAQLPNSIQSRVQKQVLSIPFWTWISWSNRVVMRKSCGTSNTNVAYIPKKSLVNIGIIEKLDRNISHITYGKPSFHRVSQHYSLKALSISSY